MYEIPTSYINKFKKCDNTRFARDIVFIFL